jgi:hypothetical protein
MKKAILVLSAIAIMLPYSAIAATPTTEPTMSGRCSKLKSQWKSIEQEMADREAEGITDNSAPRATLRATEDSNDLAKAQIILTLSQAYKCPLPPSAPSYINFFSNALSCRTDVMKGASNSPKCDRSSWKPLAEW